MSKEEKLPKDPLELLDYLFQDDHLPSSAREIILLRVKLEQRTLFLRVSLALNIALVAGIVARVIM